MEPTGLPFVGKSNEHKEEEIPIIVRSVRDGNHIQDIMQLQEGELKLLSQQLGKLHSFVKRPFALPGCNMGEVGTHMGKSMLRSVI